MKKLSKNARKQLLNILFLLLLIGVTLTVLLLCNQELNFETIGNFIKRCNPWLLVSAVGCMLAGIVFEGLSLFLISRRLGHKGKLVSAMVYSTADIYYSAITPSASGGQPASAYYMCKDGMNVGTATFTLVFNVIAYTAAFIVLALIAFIIRPALFAQFGFLPKFFVILGVVIQAVFLAFLIACMFCHKAILKVGNGLISFLVKIKIIKKEEKWRKKISDAVDKYGSCTQVFKNHPWLFVHVLLLNIGQRVARVLIACCVCLAADPTMSFWDIFALQAFLIVGYTSLPLPGGTGAFEFLYLRIFGVLAIDGAFLGASLMVVRTIQYYLSIVITGIATLAYHAYLIKRTPRGAVEQGSEEGAQAEITAEAAQTDQVSDGEAVEEQASPEGENTEENSEENEEHV